MRSYLPVVPMKNPTFGVKYKNSSAVLGAKVFCLICVCKHFIAFQFTF